MPARSLEELQKQYSGAQGGASGVKSAGGPGNGGPGHGRGPRPQGKSKNTKHVLKRLM